MAPALTAGERYEQFAQDALMDKGAVARQRRGRHGLRAILTVSIGVLKGL